MTEPMPSLATVVRAGRSSAGRLGALLLAALVLGACEPTVRVMPPAEPITINLNVKLDAEVRVKLERQAEEDIRKNEDIF